MSNQFELLNIIFSNSNKDIHTTRLPWGRYKQHKTFSYQAGRKKSTGTAMAKIKFTKPEAQPAIHLQVWCELVPRGRRRLRQHLPFFNSPKSMIDWKYLLSIFATASLMVLATNL